MPALAPIPPEQLKRVMEILDFIVVDEDQYNWLMDKEGRNDPPITIPKIGPLVALQIMDAVIQQASVNHFQYFEALKKTQN